MATVSAVTSRKEKKIGNRNKTWKIRQIKAGTKESGNSKTSMTSGAESEHLGTGRRKTKKIHTRTANIAGTEEERV